VATLYRCPTPTDRLCPCGKVARRLRAAGVEFEEVRVPFSRRERPEVVELTGQSWVPVLVHGEEVVFDSRRIVEYLEHVEASRDVAGAAPAAR
jgi:glutathione S-transferase